MSDENVNKVEASVNLLSSISERVKHSAEDVRKQVIEQRVKAVVDQRADMLDKALTVRETLSKEINKISKPDVQTYTESGAVASSSYSEERVKQLKDKREKLAKVDKAIALALDNNDWSKLNEVKADKPEQKKE